MTGRSQIWDGAQWVALSDNPGSKGETGDTGPPGEGGELSLDANNQLILGSDSLHYCPEFADGVYLKLSGGTLTGRVLFPDGSLSSPSISFSGDTDTGLVLSGPNQIGLITDSVRRILVGATGNITFGDDITGKGVVRNFTGDPINPTWTFNQDTNTGMYRVAADQLGFAVGGANKVTISTSLAIFDLPIHVKEQTFGVAHYRLDDDAFRASPVFNNTVTTASTVYVTTGGVLMRSTAIAVSADTADQATLDTRIGESFFDNSLEAIDLAALTNYILDRIDALEAFHP